MKTGHCKGSLKAPLKATSASPFVHHCTISDPVRCSIDWYCSRSSTACSPDPAPGQRTLLFARLAHRVLCHGQQAAGPEDGHPHWRRGPQVSPPRQRAGTGRGTLPPGVRLRGAVGQLLPALRPPEHQRAEDVQIVEKLLHDKVDFRFKLSSFIRGWKYQPRGVSMMSASRRALKCSADLCQRKGMGLTTCKMSSHVNTRGQEARHK